MRKRVVTLLFAYCSVGDAVDRQRRTRSPTSPTLNAVRTAIRSDKRAFVASTLKLTDAQAKKFWPIYDAYQRSLDSSNRQRVVALEQVILRDKVPRSSMPGGSRAICSPRTRRSSRRGARCRMRVMRALPAAKAARYLQLESKIRAVQAYDIASAIPLVR